MTKSSTVAFVLLLFCMTVFWLVSVMGRGVLYETVALATMVFFGGVSLICRAIEQKGKE